MSGRDRNNFYTSIKAIYTDGKNEGRKEGKSLFDKVYMKIMVFTVQ